MNIGVKENTIQLLFIGALIVLVGVVSFFKWPGDVTGATTRVPACIVPTEEVTTSVAFCTGTYTLPNGVRVVGNGLTVDCNNAVLAGEGKGIGITLEGNGNIVKDCNLRGFATGVEDHGAGNQFVHVEMSSSS